MHQEVNIWRPEPDLERSCKHRKRNKMRILLTFILSFMTGCVSSFKVTGYSGGTVIIHCHFDYYRGEREIEIFFCKGRNLLSCVDKIRTSQNTWQNRGRFSMHDDTGENFFKVVIRQLTRQDEGIYWCGMDTLKSNKNNNKVELEVKEDKCCKISVTETVRLGGEAAILCNYPKKYESSNKYFCKEDSTPDCKYMMSAKSSLQEGRFSLSKKRAEKSFTVTISDLAEYDTGTYWCGVDTRRSNYGYITLITQVNLRVLNIA
ncbi:polymeric immunoglobulin receptor [Esox lucius]|uniref:polymeric immunoglobulin receptor n=1 Tax=Esox lucius TaxID=8010 RepID=UPI001476E1D1|nr:polymeric immunoglobulin receptor [Esox lucius]